MTALTFTPKDKLQFPVDLSSLVPELLTGKDKQQISADLLAYGKQNVEVSSLFRITGDDPEKIRFKNCCHQMTHIGGNMRKGHILVEGNAGDYLGRNMHDGKIEVKGNTGSWSGSAMTGGKIEIYGNTENYLGACPQGKAMGMSGGTIIVHGNAGTRIGERMRRGTIVIFGQCGEYAACKMLAGTIIILGKTGSYLGIGMKRGTIILSKKPRHLLATFRHCGYLKIEFLRLLFKQLGSSCRTFKVFSSFGPEAIRYAGDMANDGMGEILVLKNARVAK